MPEFSQALQTTAYDAAELADIRRIFDRLCDHFELQPSEGNVAQREALAKVVMEVADTGARGETLFKWVRTLLTDEHRRLTRESGSRQQHAIEGEH